jgi:hypothetical protein
MRTPESPNEPGAAGTPARHANGREGQVGDGSPLRAASLPALYSEMLAVATCFVFGGWLGLPAAMHILRHRPQGLARRPEAAANDERFEA